MERSQSSPIPEIQNISGVRSLHGIPYSMGAVEDVENILSVLKEFSSPYSFAFHVGKDLLVNGVNIIHEISAAIDDWDAQSYRDCGVQIGTALNQLLIGAEEQN